MSEYTPTTKQVRQGYIWDYCPENTEERKILFDRWLAAHDAATRTATLEEAAVIADSFGGTEWGIATAIRAAKVETE